jgi:phytoene synthase
MSNADTSAQAYDLAACVALMRGGSKTFFAASRLLPVRVRSASVALYAFCRVADDLVDNGDDPSHSLLVLKERLDWIYAGQPSPALEDQALALVVGQYQLPRLLLDALLEGFYWDAQGRAYPTIESVHDYGARVAATVGAMMCLIMGVNSPVALARACELGVAMQLTNIARDVGEDARNGRLYLPHEWLRQEGIDPITWLQRPVFNAGVARVVERLLDEADRLYQRASAGIAELPKDCRAAILAARLIYAEIGHQLRRMGCNSVDQRTVVSGAMKLALIGQSQIQAGWLKKDVHAPQPLPAIAYLVRGCEASAQEDSLPKFQPSKTVSQRVSWMLALFERLESDRRQPMSHDTVAQQRWG